MNCDNLIIIRFYFTIIIIVLINSSNGGINKQVTDTSSIELLVDNNSSTLPYSSCQSNKTENIMHMIFRSFGCTLESGVIKIKTGVGSSLNFFKNTVSPTQIDKSFVWNHNNSSIDSETSTIKYNDTKIIFRDDNEEQDNMSTTTQFAIDTRSLFNAPSLCPKNQRMGKDGNCRIVVS